MIASVLLLLIGLSDVVRAGPSRFPAWALAAVVWFGVGGLAVWGLGLPPFAVAACVALAAGWMLALPVEDSSRPRLLWPVLALVAVVSALTAFDPTTADGFLLDTYANIANDAIGAVSPETALAAIAVAVFLTRSGNIVVRAALGRSHGDAVPRAPIPWELRIRGRLLGTVDRPSPTQPGPATSLRGGRFIGPSERLLILGLAVVGAETLIAGLLAAKGVVRFPEISEDRASGSKAEEFLVGSLTSWALSAAAVLYLFVVNNG